ncbi:helix-turn-helix transcriptional regulator [Candidatus Venteria ishoeyi]|uniref:helix-turn-helix transcriptional regulator n=1 Tax=Candidatus Venteria ishoeyi TaxID=1899563 RepID=UPI00255C2BC5|nr:helix-turn-helix transcriptional regulator [Candidatus Venteria ishoeyi]
MNQDLQINVTIYYKSVIVQINKMKNKVLTKQENRVAHLIANEFLEKEIAATLFISVHTVHTHTKNIRKKLNVKNIAGITREYMLRLTNCADVLKPQIIK